VKRSIENRSGSFGATELSRERSGTSGSIPDGKIVVVASRYNVEVCDALAIAAVQTLRSAGVDEDDIEVVRVPGAWELSLQVARELERPEVIATIALGVVIKGDTTHDEHINRAVSMSLMQLGIDMLKPVAFGLLTCNTPEQATARAGGEVGNKGTEAAEAALEMLRLDVES